MIKKQHTNKQNKKPKRKKMNYLEKVIGIKEKLQKSSNIIYFIREKERIGNNETSVG